MVERVRHLVGNSEGVNLSNINVPQHMVASSSDLTTSDLQPQHLNKLKLKQSDSSELPDRATTTRTRETLKSWNAETELTLEDASLVVIEDMLESQSKAGDGSSHNESERATSEPEGEHEKESENDSIAYTSMEKEFRKLIQENKDLLKTKNALNVVKDDLIAEVDRLTNEVSMYEQAVEQLNLTKDQMKQKVSTLDAELRKTKEELEKAKQKIREVSNVDVYNNLKWIIAILRSFYLRNIKTFCMITTSCSYVNLTDNNYFYRYISIEQRGGCPLLPTETIWSR